MSEEKFVFTQGKVTMPDGSLYQMTEKQIR